MQTTADEATNFVEPESGEMTGSKSQQDEKDRKIDELEKEKQHLAEKLKENEEKLELLQQESVQLKEGADHLGTKLKEKGTDVEVCVLPPKHYMEEIRRQKEELENKHEQEMNQLKAALKDKEKGEADSREEMDKLRQELEKTNEMYTKDIEKNKQEMDRLHQDLNEATKRYAKDFVQFKSDSEQKDAVEQALRKELEEANARLTQTIQQLSLELKQKDEQHANETADIKSECEGKHKQEMHQKEAEFDKKLKTKDAATRDLIHKLREVKKEVGGLQEEVKKLKTDLEDKSNAAAELTKELEKARQKCQEKEHEKQQCVLVTKSNSERIQHEQKRQLEIKKKEIVSLEQQLHEAVTELRAVSEGKSESKIVQELNEQLQEKDNKLLAVVNQVEELRGKCTKLTADNEHLQNLYEQLMVEANAKKELATSSSCDDPCGTTLSEPQVQ